ncbi:hypothetical protein [Ancylomarina sp. 16SWW S1-10-2]|uniref:hypothetical protein n=1 Tax=Ancylomarina sp. 16SWW S1-10-2 TaxID=2499681 RepID=UPI0012AD7DBB|nr:hypothetical protein [Ancylomarina sp. 16SWW S1-10-2]MRT91652.1 hypothetical protein [Ancylomarina sp. 16SWW S1-10-2]
MSIKPITSFLEGLKNKITNPYFGTLIGVWIIHNYKFVYSVFTFDSNTKLETRLKLVDKYLESGVFLDNLFTCIWVALVVLIITYSLLIISRAIVTLFDKRLSLWVYKYIYSKKIKSIEDFEEVVHLGGMAQKRYEEEQKLRLALQTEYKQLEIRYQAEILKIKELEDSIEKEKTNEKEDLVSKNIVDALSKPEGHFNPNDYPVSSVKSDPFESVNKDRIKTLLQNNELIELFNKVTISILKKLPLQDDESYDQLVLTGVIEVLERDYENVTFGFTSNGNYLRKLLLDNVENNSRKLFKDE